MRKDNSNNAQPDHGEVWITISGSREGQHAGNDDDDESKRVDCTANIDVANSPSPSPPVYLSKVTSYTNEGFKTSPRRWANQASSLATFENFPPISRFPSAKAGEIYL